MKGGESGPAVVPGKPDESPLLMAVQRLDDVVAMPPDKPLSPGSVKALERWISTGANWPERSIPIEAARHWAFEPPRASAPPTTDPNPIDAFLAVKQRRAGVTSLGPADKRTLIRRASFDLLGLPPTPEDVTAFLSDSSPDAFARLVDRLLASPQYGERWGRIWLDVVRYADTAGETADMPVPDAWRYRDYVINAFNADKPFDQFVREQLAGDLLAASAPSARHPELVTATGYLAIARRFGFDITKDFHLTIDDAIDTIGTSFLGLTIACARCHDHKYDPISTADYYAIYGILDSTRFPFPGCEKDRVPRDNVPLRSTAETDRALAPIRAEAASCEAEVARREQGIARLEAQPATSLVSGDIPNGGKADFAAGKGADALRSVTIHKGKSIRLAIAPKVGHGADSTRVELKIAESGGTGQVWSLASDALVREGPNRRESPWRVWDGAATPRPFTEAGPYDGGYAGLVAWRGSETFPCVFINTNDRAIVFQTVKQPARSVALHPGPKGSVVVAWESPIDGLVTVSGLVEDIDSSGGDGIAWSLAVAPGLTKGLDETAGAVANLVKARKNLDAFGRSIPLGYAVAEGKPHNARIHERGDPETLGPEVPRRFLDVLGGQPVPPGAGSGRLQLAAWISDASNPLTARVIVNRVWQGHFGSGLVRTPNNFGARGEPPTHPALLDWLAIRFVADGWSIKRLHRLIMSSNAYQMMGGSDESNARVDPDNADLWRFDRRRLSAEEIRDAMLAVSGDLDPTPGGPHPFPPSTTWGFTQHNPFVAVYDHNRRASP